MRERLERKGSRHEHRIRTVPEKKIRFRSRRLMIMLIAIALLAIATVVIVVLVVAGGNPTNMPTRH